VFSGDCEGQEEPGVDHRKLDVGAVVGAGLSFRLSERLDVMVNGGLDMGLTSIAQRAFAEEVIASLDRPFPAADGDGKNSAWFLTAGVRFPLGG
jgi:hypothetical protein